jgi:hypothetical protein
MSIYKVTEIFFLFIETYKWEFNKRNGRKIWEWLGRFFYYHIIVALGVHYDIYKNSYDVL